MPEIAPQQGGSLCSGCGAALHPAALACGRCHALVHKDRLESLVAEARAATDPSVALAAWRSALDLLPPHTRQAGLIREQIAVGVKELDAGNGWNKVAGVGGAVGGAALFLWKFKAIAVLLLTKGKLLLLGLTKWKMMASMFLSLGVYWTVFGWQFAVGLIANMYVHEMGHVFALQRYGIKASAPMFVPGLGAYVRLDQYPQSVGENARIGLAGPIWGISAAIFCLVVGWTFSSPTWLAIGKVGGWLNLFNLVPFWQLDGARGLQALGRWQRWGLFAAVVGMYLLTGDGLLILIGLVLGWRLFTDRPPAVGNLEMFIQFVGVLVIGSAMNLVDVPMPGRAAP